MDAASFKAAVQALEAIPQLLRDEVCGMAEKLKEPMRDEALAKLKLTNVSLAKNRVEALAHTDSALVGIRVVKKRVTKFVREEEEKTGHEAEASSAEQLLNQA
jgi:hypothetical protein